MESQSLWHKVIRSKYGLQVNGWNALPLRKVSSRSPWKDISSGSHQFLICCKFEAGNGERVRFWEDGWLAGGPLKEQFPRLFLLSRKQSHNMSSFVEVSSNSLSLNFDFRKNPNEMEIEEVATLLQKVEEVRSSPSKMDNIRWNLEASGFVLIIGVLHCSSLPFAAAALPHLQRFMSGRIGVASNATGTQHADLPTSVAVVDLNSLVLQDVPTIYNDEYNNASSSLLFLNNGSNPSHTFASIFEQTIPTNDVSASLLEDGTSSHLISIPVCLADRATLHYLLAGDTQIVHSVANSLIIGQAAYLERKKKQTKKHAKHTSSVSTPQFTACCMSYKYNLPASDGIDGLIVGDIGQFHTERDIVVEHKTYGLQRITKLHPRYMALQYPLLFPYGEDGYRKGGRLFQQYLVDAYATLEEDRLDFIRANQDSLRTEGLKGIHEAFKARNAAGSTIGKRVILPTSFTYITKGVDQARVVFKDEEFDEIVAYLNCRYLCPYEAVWRLLQFHIHFREPSVERLSMDLPSDQNVVFKETDDLNHVVNHPNLKSTMLTQWFQTNVQDPDAHELPYVEFLTNFGFDHLRTVNGVLQPTFQVACTSLGLLGDDREWNNAMLEVVLTASSSQLRQLFVTLILFCDVADPSALFETHWKTICDDIMKNMMNAFGLQEVSKYQDEARNLLLYELEKLFVAANSSLSKHHLPQPNNLMMDRLANRSLREELDYDVNKLKHEHSLLINQLNQKQQYVYNSVMETIHNNRFGLFFVHGHGGTGKIFLWTTIIAKIRSQNQIVLAVASSGIASLLLPGGRRAHSRFKNPINVKDWSKPSFDHLPFGGKPILFGGDFRQILSIVPNGSVADIVEASLTSSYLWPYLTVFFLKQNMRLSKIGLDEREKQELADFARWILDIGNGTVARSLSSTDEESCWVQILEQFLIRFDEDPIKVMVSVVYTDFMTNFQDLPYLKERVIVAPRNDTAAKINDFLLGMVPSESRTYLSFDSVSSSTENLENLDVLYPTEFLNQLDLPGLPHHKLVLKVGPPMMLIRN
ncbi:unnamed protein product [Malus baccata var. baccata]